MSQPKKSLKEAVLEAAVALVEETGAAQLTLDAVAAKAGVSKGGLLHHFRSKDALLVAMVDQLVENFEADWRGSMAELEGAAASQTERDIKLITTYLDRSFSGLGVLNRSAMTLLAMAAHEPTLRQPIKDYYNHRVSDILAHSVNAMAMISIMQLADGLWLFDALGISPFEGELRAHLSETVKKWARQVIETSQPIGA